MITNNQFYFNNGKDAPVDPNALLLTWWTSLAVKPSNALMTALNTLSQGLFDDGNWAKLDLFGLLGGMETQEQRLRPLITTSGDDFVINGDIILDSNGARSNLDSVAYLDLKWNPTVDGTQYALGSAFISNFIGSVPTAGYGTSATMGGYNTASGGESDFVEYEGVELTGTLNSGLDSVTYPQITNGTQVYYGAVVVNSGNITLYKNSTTNTVAVSGTPTLLNADFYGINLNADGSPFSSVFDAHIRHFMAGAGTANQTTIQSRLNTFYTSRGL